jgi:lipopolysaccharide biosynthesis regulator YciM
VRASLLQGDIEVQQDSNLRQAIACWQRIEAAGPHLSGAGRATLAGRFRKLERRDEGCSCCAVIWNAIHSLDLLDVVFQLVLESEGPKQRIRWCATN